MKIFSEIVQWFKQTDEKILENHLKKDRQALKNTLIELREEWWDLNDLLDSLEGIVERDEEEAVETSQKKAGEETVYASEELKDVEKKLNKIWSKKSEERSKEEQNYLSKELARAKVVKQRIENRLLKLDGIIAKTTVLLDDLDEDLCKELSGGHSLASVGQALLDKFGTELKEDRHAGRKIIRRFLEDHYQIEKPASRHLFSLLEEVGTLRYRVEVPEELKTVPIDYYSWDEDALAEAYIGPSTELFGKWEINA